MDAIRSLVNSKKFIVAVAGMLVAAGARLGLQLDLQDVAVIVSPIIAYVVSQGLADRGKDAAKIAAAVEVNPARAKEMVKADSQP